MSKQEKIEAYLDGTLTGKELEEFEIKLKSDKKFAGEVELHRDINEALKDTEIIELREQLNEIHHKLKKEGKLDGEYVEGDNKPIIRSMRKWYYAAAAGIALLIGVSALLYILMRAPLNERLYSENFAPYSFSERSEGPVAATKFDQALALYNSEKYEKAWAMMSEVDVSDSSYIAALLVRGISAMEINKHDDAIIAFEKIIKDNTTYYVEQAEWYLALCYLKNGDIKANALLTKIASGNDYYKQKAQEILDRLK